MEYKKYIFITFITGSLFSIVLGIVKRYTSIISSDIAYHFISVLGISAISLYCIRCYNIQQSNVQLSLQRVH